MDDRQETIFHVGIKPINRFLNTAWAVRKDAPLYNKVFIETIEIFMNAAPQIALVAAEASGDLLAAHLITALRKLRPESRFFGIGGPLMRQQGMECYFDIEELAVMGFSEVLHKLPRLVRIRRDIKDIILKKGADIFIGVDAPDFNFALERIFHRQGLTTIHYVSPSVWAWRKRRVRPLARNTDEVLCLFPMEPKIYHQVGGKATYVGHPLASLIPLSLNQKEARQKLSLPLRRPLIGLMPGSRDAEINRLFPLFLQVAEQLYRQNPDTLFYLLVANDHAHQLLRRLLPERLQTLPIIWVKAEQKHQAIAACDALLVASGTATLEVALCHRPMVVAYKTSSLSYVIARTLVKTPWIALPKILLQEEIVPEFIQERANPANLLKAIQYFLNNAGAQEKAVTAFTQLHHTLRGPTSILAAETILRLL